MEFQNQKEVFLYVWNTRPHLSEISGKVIREPIAWCFAHVLGKGMHPRFKLDPNNIILVSDADEHREVDRLASGKKYLLEQYLLRGERITVDIIKTL